MFENLKDTFVGFGRFGHGFGSNGFGPRFGRGDIKLVLLDLLQDKPRHGYEIIQDLEKKFHGCYTPSSGTIYPTLQLLEDQDLVTSDQKEGKKVYTITDDGLKFLKDNKNSVKEMMCRVGGSWCVQGEFIAEIKLIFNDTAQLLLAKIASDKLSELQKEQLKEAFKKLSKDVTNIISEK